MILPYRAVVRRVKASTHRAMQGHDLTAQHWTTHQAAAATTTTMRRPTYRPESDPRRALLHGLISCLHDKSGRRRTLARGLHMQRATIIGGPSSRP